MPPAIRTFPFCKRVAVWPERGSSMGDAGAMEPADETSARTVFWTRGDFDSRTATTRARVTRTPNNRRMEPPRAQDELAEQKLQVARSSILVHPDAPGKRACLFIGYGMPG